MDSLVGLFPTDFKSAWVIFTAILIVICWITYVMMHNLIVSLSVGIVGEAILTVLYFIKPTIFDGLVVRVFDWFSVIARFNNFVMGVLNLSSVIYYISIVFLFLFLTVQAIKKSRWS